MTRACKTSPSAALQIDLFGRPRRPRPRLMRLTGRSWDVDGAEVCWFECPRCGHDSGIRQWPHANTRRLACPKCEEVKP